MTLAANDKEAKTTGFIIGLKNTFPVYEKLKRKSLPNLLLRDFVPQKEILAHPKTKLFMTHGGANSVVEGIYFGKQMLGFPIMDE